MVWFLYLYCHSSESITFIHWLGSTVITDIFYGSPFCLLSLFPSLLPSFHIYTFQLHLFSIFSSSCLTTFTNCSLSWYMICDLVHSCFRTLCPDSELWRVSPWSYLAGINHLIPTSLCSINTFNQLHKPSQFLYTTEHACAAY